MPLLRIAHGTAIGLILIELGSLLYPAGHDNATSSRRLNRGTASLRGHLLPARTGWKPDQAARGAAGVGSYVVSLRDRSIRCGSRCAPPPGAGTRSAAAS